MCKLDTNKLRYARREELAAAYCSGNLYSVAYFIEKTGDKKRVLLGWYTLPSGELLKTYVRNHAYNPEEGVYKPPINLQKYKETSTGVWESAPIELHYFVPESWPQHTHVPSGHTPVLFPE